MPEEEASKFDELALPPLPARYWGVDVPKRWFLTCKNGKRRRAHRNSHGVASFSEISRIASSNWKTIDAETREFVSAVYITLKPYIKKRPKRKDLPPPKKRLSDRGVEDAQRKCSKNDGCKSLHLSSGPCPTSFSGSNLPRRTSITPAFRLPPAPLNSRGKSPEDHAKQTRLAGATAAGAPPERALAAAKAARAPTLPENATELAGDSVIPRRCKVLGEIDKAWQTLQGNRRLEERASKHLGKCQEAVILATLDLLHAMDHATEPLFSSSGEEGHKESQNELKVCQDRAKVFTDQMIQAMEEANDAKERVKEGEERLRNARQKWVELKGDGDPRSKDDQEPSDGDRGAESKRSLDVHCNDYSSAREGQRRRAGEQRAGERCVLSISPVVARRKPPADVHRLREEGRDEIDGVDDSSAKGGQEGRRGEQKSASVLPITTWPMRPTRANDRQERSASERYAAFCPPIVTRGEEQDSASHVVSHDAAPPSLAASDREWQEWPRPTNMPNEDSAVHFCLYPPPGPWGPSLKGYDPNNDPASSRRGLVVDRIEQNSRFVGTVQRGDEIV